MSRERHATVVPAQLRGNRRATPLRRRSAAGLLALVALTLTSCSDRSELTVVVDHPRIENIHLADLADEGPSAGDIRVFTVSGTSDDDTPVRTDWELVTIDHSDNEEVRNARATFVFGDGTDQLLLMGSAAYPVDGGTLDKGVVVRRAVVGGTGRYSGATGWVETTHRPDDTWTHIFHVTLP